MNISYRWLRALAPGLDDPPERLVERLAMYGAPVEEVVQIGAGLGDVVIGRVLDVRPHPNADRLRLCVVEAGGEPLQVVCGAPNVRAGGYYPFAPVGAVLPGGVQIRKAKIRGEESQGMLCSERELGLGRDHDGLMELAGEWDPGASFVAALGLDDVRLVLEVTANRPDLLSHIGVARELGPGGRVELPAFPGTGGAALAELRFIQEREQGVVDGVRVVIEDAAGCTRYLGAVVRGVRVAPSPAWLAARLRAIGLRPINNVVDATNYVLHELGQPLHAFDLRRLRGGMVSIRRGRQGEALITLDGVRREVSRDALVIADGVGPVALAGIMGGEESEVTGETVDIFLECAIFDPKTVRRTRRALGMSTDASYRFERGVDPEGCRRAVQRAIALIQAVAGGEVVGGAVLELETVGLDAVVVPLRRSRVTRVLGAHFETEQIVGCLAPLGFEVVEGGEADPDVTRFRVPGHRRYDVSQEIDLIEEVARRHGYDVFPQTLAPFRPSAVPDDPLAGLEDRLRTALVARGFLEARTAPFAPESRGDVALSNPLSSAEGRLRRALLPGLVARLEHNFARGARHVRLFEIGTVFGLGPDGGLPVERTRFAAILTGARRPPHWSEPAPAFDAWDLKGLLEDVAAVLGLPTGSVRPPAGGATAESGFDPTTTLALHDGTGVEIGRGGRLLDREVDAPAWADDVWGLEVEIGPTLAQRPQPVYAPLPAFPAIERDLALIVSESMNAAVVEATIRGAAGPLLEFVGPFDVYRGPGLPPGTRSIAFRLRFRATDRTLTDPEADDAVARVLRALKEELDVERRG